MVGLSQTPRRHDPRELREALDAVARTAGNLAAATNDPDVIGCLAEADPSVPSSSWAEILASAPEIVRQACLALERIPDGMGQDGR